MLKHKVGDIVTLNEKVEVDINKLFHTGVKVEIEELCCQGTDEEHYTVRLLNDGRKAWWIQDFEIEEKHQFNIGDKVVCVCRDEGNWYKIGSEFTIRSDSFIDYDDFTVCYRVEEESDNGTWIQGDHFNLVKGEPKQMKATDKITVEITLAELAKVYALTSKANGSTRSSLYETARNMIDPDNNRAIFMRDMSQSKVLDYNSYEQEFLKLMFPEPPKKSPQQIKIEELQATIDRACKEIRELREMGENK